MIVFDLPERIQKIGDTYWVPPVQGFHSPPKTLPRRGAFVDAAIAESHSDKIRKIFGKHPAGKKAAKSLSLAAKCLKAQDEISRSIFWQASPEESRFASALAIEKLRQNQIYHLLQFCELFLELLKTEPRAEFIKKDVEIILRKAQKEVLFSLKRVKKRKVKYRQLVLFEFEKIY